MLGAPAIRPDLDQEATSVSSRCVPSGGASKPFKVSGRVPIQFRHAVCAADFRVPQTRCADPRRRRTALPGDRVTSPTFPDSRVPDDPQRIITLRVLGGAERRSQVGLHEARPRRGHGRYRGRSRPRCSTSGGAPPSSRSSSDGIGSGPRPVRDVERSARPAQLDFDRLLVDVDRNPHVPLGDRHDDPQDKVFDWIFRLCPRHIQPWIVGGLDHFATKWTPS